MVAKMDSGDCLDWVPIVSCNALPSVKFLTAYALQVISLGPIE